MFYVESCTQCKQRSASKKLDGKISRNVGHIGEYENYEQAVHAIEKDKKLAKTTDGQIAPTEYFIFQLVNKIN